MIPMLTQTAEGDLIDQLQGSYDTNIQNQQQLETETTLTKISTMEQLKIKLLNGNGMTQNQLADNLSEQISDVIGNENDADQYSYNFNNQDQVGDNWKCSPRSNFN